MEDINYTISIICNIILAITSLGTYRLGVKAGRKKMQEIYKVSNQSGDNINNGINSGSIGDRFR